MIRRRDRVLCALLLAAVPVLASAVVLTGEVQAVDSQIIYTPEANMVPVTIRFFVPEGARVKKGDVVLRVDAGQAAARIPDLEAQVEQAQARGAKEVAELQVKAVDAQIALADAEAALATARIDAKIPADLISRLDFDRYQGELDRSTREVGLKRSELGNAQAAVARRIEDGKLEVRKLELERDFLAAQVRNAEVRADRDGVVLHGFNNNWIGGRIDEGSATIPGSKAGEVVRGKDVRVRAWALEPDRRGLKVGQPVTLAFDAFRGRNVAGRITAIAGAPDTREEWGKGRYFTVEIELAKQGQLPLLPGMSARVVVDDARVTNEVPR
jgi:multidrug resistance efflux pump